MKKKCLLTCMQRIILLLVALSIPVLAFSRVHSGCPVDTFVPLEGFRIQEFKGSLHFLINEYIADESQLRNALDQEIRRLESSEDIRIVRVVIKGAASPDGPFPTNEALSIKRQQTLDRIVRDCFFKAGISSALASTEYVLCNVAEDFDRLVALLRENGDPAAESVSALMEKYLPDNPVAIEAQLRSMQGGTVWARLRRDYFPLLRYAEVICYYEHTVQEAEAEEETVPVAEVMEDEPVVVPVEETPSQHVDAIAAEPVFRRPILSVKSNLLMDLAYLPQYGFCPMPNLDVEYLPEHGHLTFQLGLDCPWWSGRAEEHKYFQLRNYHAEARWYFKDSAWNRLYASIYGNAGLYGIGLNSSEGWQGEGWGAGIGAGYVLPLSRNGYWKLDLGIQCGYLSSKYDPYVYGDPVNGAQDGLYYYNYTGNADDFVERQYHFSWVGPTRLTVSICRDILFVKKR